MSAPHPHQSGPPRSHHRASALPPQTADNTKVACACANGEALVGEVVGRSVSDRHLTVTMVSSDTVQVTNAITGTKDTVGV